jgi:molecular chaperone GrpE
MSKHGHKPGNTGETKENQQQTEVPADSVPGGQDAATVTVPQEDAGKGQENTAPGSEPAKYEELEAKLAELNDQYLRKAADFENFRKRTIREKQELTEFANQNLLLDLLPIIDDFERALKSAETSKDFASFYEGIRMIEKGLSSQLESKWGLKRFDSAGEPFDPNRHEAIQVEKTAEISEPVVKEDYLKGYLLKERVIRCAKVKVLMPEGESAAPSAGEGVSSA